MPATELKIRVRIGTPIDMLTEKYPSLRVWTWCNYVQDVHEIVSEDPAQFHDALDEFIGIYHVLEETEISSSIRMITQNCVCSKETTVHDNIQELEILNLMPIYCEGDYEHYRLIAFRHEDLSELFDRLQAVVSRWRWRRRRPSTAWSPIPSSLSTPSLIGLPRSR
jgi:predicted DNA binding protein